MTQIFLLHEMGGNLIPLAVDSTPPQESKTKIEKKEVSIWLKLQAFNLVYKEQFL